MTYAPWMTDANVAKARELWDEGATTTAIAKRIGDGCTKNSIVGIARRRGWPARPSPILRDGIARERRPQPAAARTTNPALGYTREQMSKLRELWSTDTDVPVILDEVNGVGPKQFTEKQLRDLAKRFDLKRPITRPKTRLVRWNKQRNEKQSGTPPILLQLRQVHQMAAQLDLPLSERGDIQALTRAMQREQPDHPGFALANYIPTRLIWAI